MTFSRPLATLVAALALLLWAAPAGATDSGGVAVQSYDGSGGGVVAPAPEPAATPVADAAQEETPTTPEGEEQPPEQEPNGEQPPTEDDPGPVDELPDDVAGESPGETAGGSLPRTGFELAALSAIGLGLLLAGGALWPTSSWPPSRDRLSR